MEPRAGVYTPVPTSSFSALSDGTAVYQGRPSLFKVVSNSWASSSLLKKSIFVLATMAAIGGAIGGALSRKKPSSAPPLTGICAWSNYRLPTNVVPINYSTIWAPSTDGNAFIEPLTFSGVTSMALTVNSDTPCVVVHAQGLTISRVTLVNARTQIGGVASWWPDTSAAGLGERVIVSAANAPSVIGDVITLTFTYAAPLGTTNNGLYLSQYVDDNGKTVNIIATQFEATAARKAFPCMDEPGFKANFSITLDGLPKGYTALSNMPNQTTLMRPDGGTKVIFATTPRISTYLVALVAGPLVSVTFPNLIGRGQIPVTGWAVNRANNIYKLGYAVDACAAILPYYESLYDLGFPLPKMDMVALPDFAAGAMENVGLVTYRETAMLANTTTSSAAELQRVAVVVAHELAHQWFGDLTTMA